MLHEYITTIYPVIRVINRVSAPLTVTNARSNCLKKRSKTNTANLLRIGKRISSLLELNVFRSWVLI